MRLLLTRPEEDAGALAAELEAHGHSVLVAPLMKVQLRPGPSLELAGVQGVIATSANGVRALVTRTPRRDVPIYAVGPQTAEAARRAGFALVRDAGGNAAALAAALPGWTSPEKGILLHAAGSDTAGDFGVALRARGFSLKTATLYEAMPVARLPEKAEQMLRQGALDGVLLFSPRSAGIFAGLVRAAGLGATCARLTCFCISRATADALGTLAFSRVAVAASPNRDALLALISPPRRPEKPQP